MRTRPLVGSPHGARNSLAPIGLVPLVLHPELFRISGNVQQLGDGLLDVGPKLRCGLVLDLLPAIPKFSAIEIIAQLTVIGADRPT